VRGAIGADADETGAGIEHTRNAVNFGGFERLFERERRQDRGHALGQHGFAGTGRADHQDVVASGAGHFQGALGGLLSANFFEVDAEVLSFAEQSLPIDLQGCTPLPLFTKWIKSIRERTERLPPRPWRLQRAFSSGTTSRGNFSGSSFDGDGSAPRTARTPPSRESSPTKRQSGTSFLFNPP